MNEEELKNIQLGILNGSILVAVDKALARRFLRANGYFIGSFASILLPIFLALCIYSFFALKWWGILYSIVVPIIAFGFQGDVSYNRRYTKYVPDVAIIIGVAIYGIIEAKIYILILLTLLAFCYICFGYWLCRVKVISLATKDCKVLDFCLDNGILFIKNA